jgi:dipeptidyl aminopeptidase/acylaminoacyl peptidase
MLVAASLLFALAPQGGYRLPPTEVVDIVDAAPTPRVSLSPDARWMLLVERPAMPSIEDVARPWVGLAGLRVDPVTNARHRTSFEMGIVLRDLTGSSEQRVELPDGARIGSLRWSHTSRHFAFTLVQGGGSELWRADVPSGKAVKVAAGLNAMFGSGWSWMPDGQRLLVRQVPADRGAEPVDSGVPSGPTTMETKGEKSPIRTYQDLLEDPHDEALFRYLGQTQLALFDVDSGIRTKLGKPGLYLGASPSPDGEHLLVTRIDPPFSYVMAYWSFPQTVEVWSAAGELEHVAATIPMAENIPIGGVRTGPRSFNWRAGAPATLVWTEALDGGDPKREVPHRDRYVELAAPFDGEAHELLRTEQRASGLTWMKDPNLVLASDYDRDRRWTRTLLLNLVDAAAPPVVIDDRSVRDRYGDPGRPVLEVTTTGDYVVRQDGEWIYRSGSGASAEGLRPFLDRQSLTSLETERLWQCAPGSYERMSAFASSAADRAPAIVTVHESPEEPPNYRLRDLADERVTALTTFPDPTPQLRGIHKELVTYERDDGVPLSATLYLPKGYVEGTRLPLVVWAYPREFNDVKTAGQVSGTPYRFTRIGGSSHLFFLTQGYAIMDSATMPIIGDPETMNDAFIDQIVSSAQAAIDKAVEMGVADGHRVGVGGHSYGAFMTANLLAHCDLFDAGIARSGAYNRTLTPFGFQSERRTLWEAREAYARISPFFHAEKINEPMLMIHGEKDSNSGTYPIQSERMYHAIKGNGGKARLVFLPAEDHGYRARESILHTLAEMIDWFEEYVKGADVVEAGFDAKREE